MARRTVAGVTPYVFRQWRWLIVILVFTLGASLIAALQPLPVKILVDYALGTLPPPDWLSRLLAWFALPAEGSSSLLIIAGLASLLLFALNASLDAALTMAWSKAGTAMVFELANDLFARLQRLSILFHHRQPVGDSISRLSTDTWSVYTLASTLFLSPIQQLATLASVAWVAWRLDSQMASIALLSAPLLGVSSFLFSERMKRGARLTREAQSRLTSFVQQTLSAVPLVQTFSAEERNRQNFLRLSSDVVREGRLAGLYSANFGLVNALITTSGSVLVLILGAGRVLDGSLPVGTLLVFMAYMTTLQKAAEGLMRIYASFKPVEASIERIMEVLHSSEAVPQRPNPLPLPQRPRHQGGHIRFDNVSFAYEPGRQVLENLTFEARPGETIALVGHSGAGKSTLSGLIPRFFDVNQGRVLFDGIDVRDLDLVSLRSQVALVLQEPYLLPLSIAENIAYGRPGASREEIIAAAVAANAHEFIEDLSQGYDSVIGEKGATLSGGQKQRISIARALIKDARVLILDEPTSALDPRTESLVIEALTRLKRDRTTFVIAHRLSTIRSATRILVLERGRLVESGTHDDLMLLDGVYARFYRLQVAA